MTRDATKYTESCHILAKRGKPSVELQADAWALAACDFASKTRDLRKMHPGKGPMKKGLFLLGWSINETLKEKNMDNKTIMVSAEKLREILTERDKMLAQMATVKALLESIGPDGLKS